MNAKSLIPLWLVLLTAATYWPVLINDFVIHDDEHWILANPHLNPPSVQNIFYYAQHPIEGLYVPVAFVYWSILATAGMRPFVFHAGSVVIHIISVLLVYDILRRIIGDSLGAWLGAMLFAVHPLQVETVAWASGAKDLLAGMFSLLCVLNYLRAIQSNNQKNRWLAYSISLVALLLGILSKPSAVVAPLIAGAIDWLLIRKNRREMIKLVWPMVMMTIPFIIVGRNVQGVWSSTMTPLWMRPLIAGDALFFYAFKFIWPVDLTFLYGRTPQYVFETGVAYFSWLAPAAIALVLIWRGNALLKTAAVIFVIALLPVLGFTPFLFQIYSTVADHYVYLAMLGPALILAWATTYFDRRQIGMAATILLVVLMVQSMLQARVWRNSLTLTSHAVNVNPWNSDAHGMFGLSLARAGLVTDAAAQFQMVVDLRPGNPDAHAYLGRALSQIGRLDEADTQYRAALTLRPEDAALNAEWQALRARRLDSPSTRQ